MMNATNLTAAELHEFSEAFHHELSVVWVLLCSFFVISMQLGFAMLEVGSVREAHRMTVLAKNIMDSCVSCVAFWIFHQVELSINSDLHDRGDTRHLMVFQWVFCAASVTICSGSMAERTHMLAYLCFAALMAGLIYPIISISAWRQRGPFAFAFHGAWTNGHAYHDFAGAGVVHCAGGVAAWIGNSLLGRRIMRTSRGFSGHSPDAPGTSTFGSQGQNASVPSFINELRDLEEQDDDRELLLRPAAGWQRRFDNADRDDAEFRPMHYLQAIGMFTLWMGWYGFNAGSTLCMGEACSNIAGIAAWNTTVSASFGGLGAYMYSFLVSRNLQPSVLVNGILSALVAITGCCDVCKPHVAALIGFCAGGVVYPMSSKFLKTRHVDDPVDAIPVHACCGCFGLLMVAFCIPNCEMANNIDFLQMQLRFCESDFNVAWQFAAQALGLLAIVCWVTLLALPLWGLFTVSELARSLQVEYFALADNLLVNQIAAGPMNEGDLEKWKCVARYSPCARRVMKTHGWNGNGFDGDGPSDVFMLRCDLEHVRGLEAETALEVGESRVLRWLAYAVHACPLTRELTILRLRTSPHSELSGLGAADMNGGNVLRAVVKMIEVQRDSRTSNSPLKEEIRELARAVRNQDVVLQSLWRRKNGSARSPLPSQALASVPEDLNNSQENPENGVPTRCQVEASPRDTVQAASLTVFGNAERPRRRISTNLSQTTSRSTVALSEDTDRTMSDDAHLTPRSAASRTPPPTVLGMQQGGNRFSQMTPGSSTSAEEVAGQLVALIQAQQQFLQTLTRASGSQPQTPAGGVAAMSATDHNTLVAALQTLRSQQMPLNDVDSGIGSSYSLSSG